MTTLTPAGPVLSDELIDRCGGRAATYDRENRFFSEDFEELRRAGYLRMAVPRELGGFGMALDHVAQERRRLAYRAPATAIATTMHLYWTGTAAGLWRIGDTSQQWLLEATVAGDVFAAGHGEAGNDVPVLFSPSRAERVEGGPRASATGVATNTSVALVEARDQSTATGIARDGSVAIANAVGRAQAQAVALGGSIAVVSASSGWGMAFAVNGSTAVVENGAVMRDGESSIAKASGGAGCRG